MLTGGPAPSRMRAWSAGPGGLRWTWRPLPEARPGEVVLRTLAAGLCGSDLAKLAPSAGPATTPEWWPGHEVAAEHPTVAGRVVAVDPLLPCGACGSCAAGDSHLCPELRRLGADRSGGFAEYLAVPAANLVDLPAGTDPGCATLADPLAVAVHGVRCGIGPSGPVDLAVLGAGAVAVCTAAWAATHGHQVVLYVRDRGRLEPLAAGLTELGVDLRTVPAVPAGRHDAVVDAAAGAGPEPLHLAIGLVRDGGTVLVQNAYRPGVRLGLDLRDVFRRSIRLTGSYSFCRRGDDFRSAVAVLARRPGWATELTAYRRPLDQLADVVRTMTDPGTRPVKAVLLC